MLSERDRGWNLNSSKQTLNQYLDRWLEVCAKLPLCPKSFQDYEGLLRRDIRPRLGTTPLAAVSGFDIQICHCFRSSRFPHKSQSAISFFRR